MLRKGRDTNSDALQIKALLDDFMGLDIPVEKMRARLSDPNIITAIEPGVGYCQLKIRHKEKSVKVEALFPRGESVEVLKPILQYALIGAHVPPTWRVWATFWKAVDATGERDNGESECRKWQTMWPGSTIRKVNGQWVIEARMSQVI